MYEFSYLLSPSPFTGSIFTYEPAKAKLKN